MRPDMLGGANRGGSVSVGDVLDCRAAIKVRRRDNQGEKAFCRLRRREGGARPEAQAAEELTGSPPGGRIVW